jgi:hypothetical protein
VFQVGREVQEDQRFGDRIEPGTNLTERGTQLTLTSLPLRWET